MKLVASREQGFTISTYRAETRHRVQLGASREGKLQALWHEAYELTSLPTIILLAEPKPPPGSIMGRISTPK